MSSHWPLENSSATSGGRMAPPGGTSRLEAMRAQIQQKQMQEKEQKLLQMLDSQQQRAMQKANLSGVVPSKYSNGNAPARNFSNTSKPNAPQGSSSRNSQNSVVGSVGNGGAGKVRQMFEDRRKGGSGSVSVTTPTNVPGTYGGRTLAGIDKSYPLVPLDTSKVSTNRSGSSKSDPPGNSYSRGRVPAAKPPVALQQHSRSRPIPRATPTPPTNLGSTKRGISLDRNSLHEENGILTSSPFPMGKNDSAEVGIRRSASGFSIGSSSHRDENANELEERSGIKSPPIVPKTTKYRDYADELESREAALGNKMRKMHISSPVGPPNFVGSKSPSSSIHLPKVGTDSRPTLSQQNSQTQLGKATKSGSGIRKESASSPTSKRSAPAPAPGLEECHICHRFFASDRISKHESICKKTSTKKRKVFDPTKMRMEGTEAEPYLRQVSGKVKRKAPAPVPVQAKKADWRKKHEEFINTIRAAKVYTQHVAAGGNPADLPPPPPTDTSDYIQCPHCGRKFSKGAADRHIPKCQNIKSNKPR